MFELFEKIHVIQREFLKAFPMQTFGAQEFASCGLEWLVCSGRVLPLAGHIEYLPQKTHKRFKATVATFVFVGNFDVLQVHHMTFQDKYVFLFVGEWEIINDESSKRPMADI